MTVSKVKCSKLAAAWLCGWPGGIPQAPGPLRQAAGEALALAPWEPGRAGRRHGWGFPAPRLFPACRKADGNCVSQTKVRSMLRGQAAGWILMELS